MNKGNKKITINDVAKEAKTSITTISRYINGHQEKIAPLTNKRIKRAIKKLKFTPNLEAQHLRSHRNHLIIFQSADIADYFSTEVFNGIYHILKQNNFIPVLLNSNGSAKDELEILNSLNLGIFGGVILQPISNDINDFNKLTAANIPIVTIDREIPGSKWPTVVSNNFEIAKEASRYFKNKKGIKKVIIITNIIKNVSSIRQRTMGISQVFSENDTKIIDPGHSMTSATKAYRLLKKEIKSNPDSLVFSLKEKWLLDYLPRLMRDNLISKNSKTQITGFSDSHLTNIINPDIKVISQNPFDIGTNAAKIIMEKINNKDYQVPKKIAINAKF